MKDNKHTAARLGTFAGGHKVDCGDAAIGPRLAPQATSRQIKIAAFLAALVAAFASSPAFAQDAPKLPCGDSDKKCVLRLMRDHAAIKLAFWQSALSLPAGERIGPAPPELVQYITLDNIANDYPERPLATSPDPAFLADLKSAIADLPPNIWALFPRKLAGLYFVDGLGGTGYTDYVFDVRGKPVAAFVVLDAAVLAKQSANAWATWKENTPFKADARYKLDARIEEDNADSRKNALQYILLHELGHVFSVGTNIHPPWNIEPRRIAPAAKYPFFDQSWQIDRKANKYRSRFDAVFPQRARTAYYFGAKLEASEMTATYSSLLGTNYPSLYAATVPGDDFAESFASYVHVVLMNRPWQITISSDGAPLATFKSCWDEARCAAKRTRLEQLLKSAGKG